AAVEDAARDGAGGEHEARQDPTTRHLALPYLTAFAEGRALGGLVLGYSSGARPRLGLFLRLRGRAAQGALEVIEDETDGGVLTGRGHDHPLAVADEEDTLLEGRGLELAEHPLVAAHLLGGGEQLLRGPGHPAGAVA